MKVATLQRGAGHREAVCGRLPVSVCWSRTALRCRDCVRSGDGRHRRPAAGSGARAGTCARCPAHSSHAPNKNARPKLPVNSELGDRWHRGVPVEAFSGLSPGRDGAEEALPHNRKHRQTPLAGQRPAPPAGQCWERPRDRLPDGKRTLLLSRVPSSSRNEGCSL